MKNSRSLLFIFLLVALATPPSAFSQEDTTDDFSYEINKVYPYISITSAALQEARTLADLNRHYQPTWVREYLSVEVTTCSQGVVSTAVGKSGVLTATQKEKIQQADAGSDITVKVRYRPENTLNDNDPKEIDFTFTIDPEREAQYPGGTAQLQQYLKEQAIDNIPEGTFQGYKLAAVKFTVTATGEITDAHIFESSEDERVDALLLATIRNMPKWQPAEHADGTKVKQEFAFTVGNMENCLVSLLGIRRRSQEN